MAFNINDLMYTSDALTGAKPQSLPKFANPLTTRQGSNIPINNNALWLFRSEPFIDPDAYFAYGGTCRVTVFTTVFSRLTVSKNRKPFRKAFAGATL